MMKKINITIILLAIVTLSAGNVSAELFRIKDHGRLFVYDTERNYSQKEWMEIRPYACWKMSEAYANYLTRFGHISGNELDRICKEATLTNLGTFIGILDTIKPVDYRKEIQYFRQGLTLMEQGMGLGMKSGAKMRNWLDLAQENYDAYKK